MSRTDTLDAGNPSSEVPGRVSGNPRHPFPVWPVYGLILPAFVAIWGGWVGLGEMAGFGPVQLLPGISDFELNTAITLPIGMETYAAYALGVWLSGRVTGRARTFAKRSVITSLAVGAAGQIIYHLLAASHETHAPWWVTMLVACLPVAVLGMGAALAHMIRNMPEPEPVDVPEAPVLVPEPRYDYALPIGPMPGTTLADEAAAYLANTVPVSPAPLPKRWSSVELVAADDALQLSEPNLTQPERAARLGVSDSRLRQARRAVRNGEPGE